MNGISEIQLFAANGARKYLTGSELARFLEAASGMDAETSLFCQLIAHTGCRVSEALALTLSSLDPETGRVTFRTLKRRRLAYRAVPIPPDLMAALMRLARQRPLQARIWPFSRQTAWRRVKAAMAAAEITGPKATIRGLRHGFGIANAEAAVPMSTTQKWLGHAALATTAIYQQAVGREEQAFARRLWTLLASAKVD